MPIVPTYVNQVGVASSAIPATNPGVVAENKTLSGLKGLADLTAAVGKLGAEIVQAQAQREAVNILSQNTFDDAYINEKQNAPADGTGFTDRVRQAHSAYRDNLLAQTEDADVRRVLGGKIDEQLPRYLQSAAAEQHAMRQTYDVDQTNQAVSALQNGVMANPVIYDTNAALGREVIQNAPVSATLKAKMATALEQNLASTRFDGMIARAKDPAEIERIQADFAQTGWQSAMKPTDYERITRQLEEKKNHLGAKLDAEGEAFLAAAGKRTSDYSSIDASTRAELSAMVRRAPGTAKSLKAAQILREQTFLDQNNDKSLPELKALAGQMSAMASSPAGVPQRVADAVSGALAKGSGTVSAGYLLGAAQAEYGKYLAGDATDYGRGSDMGGSSTGLYQFTRDTWLGLMKDGRTAQRFGIDTQGKSDQELLALRASPETSAQMALALSEQNKAALERNLDRDVSDNELYIAHFLGAEGAVKFINAYQIAPFAKAADVVPEAAAANAPLFKNNATLKDVYDALSRRSSMNGATIAYNDLSFAQGLVAKAEKAAKDGNLIEYEAERHPGQQIVAPLTLDDPATFAERAVLANTVARKHGVPLARVKPFTPGEVDSIVQTLEDGGAEQKMAVLSAMTRLGGAMDKGLSQIGDKEPVLGYAGYMASAGEKQTALDIIKGRERLKKDKVAKALLGEDRFRIGVFSDATGEALSGLPPESMAAIRDAADAHYVEVNRAGSVDSSGVLSNVPSVNTDLYKKSVNAVLANRLGEYNGRKTLLPPQTTPEDVQRFFNNVSAYELEQLNAAPPGLVPSAPTDYKGDPVSLHALATEGKLVAIGGDRYAIMLANNRYAVRPTGRRYPDGSPEVQEYVMTLTKETIDRVNRRGNITSVPVGGQRGSLGVYN